MEWFKAAEKFNLALASSNSTPGGGAAAAMTAAMGCALALMSAQTTVNKKTTAEDIKKRLLSHIRTLGGLNVQLNHFIAEDGAAYTGYLTARKLPKEDTNRDKALQEALIYAAKVPADTATTALRCLKEIEEMQEYIAPVILSDIFCARHLLKSAVRCSIENIRANLVFIKDEVWQEKFNKQIDSFLKSC